MKRLVLLYYPLSHNISSQDNATCNFYVISECRTLSLQIQSFNVNGGIYELSIYLLKFVSLIADQSVGKHLSEMVRNMLGFFNKYAILILEKSSTCYISQLIDCYII